MDEPTASLSAHEAAELRRIARSLAASGVAVVYISHRLEEVFEIADRVTVIRDGRHISTLPVAEVTPQGMIADMVGRAVGNYFTKMPSVARDEVVLSVRGLTRSGVFEDISFDLHRGEVLCMAIGLGIAYVSEDRRKLGLAMPLPIRSNISLATLAQYLSPFGLIDRTRERATAMAYRERLNIRAPDVEMAVSMLSGGNQQKVMLAKWLAMKPDLLIVDEPTRGIDVGAKAEVHDLIRTFVREGGTALVISSDLPEVLALGDRILVMREGRQMGIIDSARATQEGIMAMATGQSEAA